VVNLEGTLLSLKKRTQQPDFDLAVVGSLNPSFVRFDDRIS
jgi:hypothetical protein